MDKSALLHQLYTQYLHVMHMSERAAELVPQSLKQKFSNTEFSSLPVNLTAIHVIDCIGRHKSVNGTTLAAHMRLSKAAISKIGSRLMNAGLITRSQLPHNKKEYFYSLTELGEELYELHSQLHHEEEQKFLSFLEEWEMEELTVIIRFLKRFSEALEERIRESEEQA